MHALQNIILYTTLFVSLYFQVFLFLTYVGWREPKDERPGFGGDDRLPTVSVMVPCWNEERTVVGTIESLLALDYPKDRLKVLMIDDGSTDRTWEVVQVFRGNPQVVLLHKENEGSKFSALNFGLRNLTTDIVGCLDADSRVDAQALRHSISWFSRDDVYAVVPSMVIDGPHTLMQYMQKVEYELSTYLRHALHRMESMYIAPGPFTLFRKEVFERLGPYHEAYHTEDLEIALRMHIEGMRLVHSPESLVYTHGPRTWPALLRQRIRWTYGFIKNVMDYRRLWFDRSYGDLWFFVLPAAFVSLGLVMATAPFLVYGLVMPIVTDIQQVAVSGIHAPTFDLGIFSLPNQESAWLAIASTALFLAGLVIGRRFILKQRVFSLDLLTVFIYPYFAAWWTIRSIWNAIRSKKNAWR